MSKVLCFGSSCKDIFFPTGEGKIMETPNDITSQRKIFFELGSKYAIEERFESLGGCAANVAVGLSRLGVGTGVVSTVGDDQVGSWIKEELEKDHVECDALTSQPGEKTGLSAIIVDKTSADRVIFHNKNSNSDIVVDPEKAKDFEWFFLGDIHGKWKDQMEAIVEAARVGTKRIAFNPREAHIQEDPAEIIEAIGLCDLVFVNKDEAIGLVSKMRQDVSLNMINNEKLLLEKLMSLEPKNVIITDGKRGAWAANREKMIYVKGLVVPAVDSTGAGDAFLSGYLAAYIKEKPFNECLQWGIASSASVVEHYGAIEGLLTEEKILERMKNIKVESL